MAVIEIAIEKTAAQMMVRPYVSPEEMEERRLMRLREKRRRLSPEEVEERRLVKEERHRLEEARRRERACDRGIARAYEMAHLMGSE